MSKGSPKRSSETLDADLSCKEATGFRPTNPSGYQTFVENPTPQGQETDNRKKRVLPNPPWGEAKPFGKPQYVVPGPSGSQPDGKSLSQDKPRTLGVPGEDRPHPDEPASTMVRKKPVEGAMIGHPFPVDRQEVQMGEAKRKSHRYYQQNRSDVKRRAKKWYMRHKQKPQFKKEIKRRRTYPRRFERKPAGGYREPADRTQDWRDDQKMASRVADFYYKKYPVPGGGWFDRAMDTLMEDNSEHKAPAEQLVEPIVMPSGPGKTIPRDNDYANRQAMSKVALRIAEIESLCERNLAQKAQSVPVKLVRVDTKNLVWKFDAKGSKPGEVYQVHVKGIPVAQNTKDPNKMDVFVSCSCPYWQWQGPEHWAVTKGYLYGSPRGTATKPDLKDPSGQHGACKHVLAVLHRVSSFVLPGKKVKLGSWEMMSSDDLDILQNVVARYLLKRGN